MENVKKGDFIEIKYSGYSQGQLFDSNIPEDLKKIDPKAKAQETVIIIGEKMVVPGLDKELEGKEVGKQYEVSISAKDGFGVRDRNLVKTIPLKLFHAQKIDPKPGMVLALDNSVAKIITISGARVITDFNNPLAGRDLVYKVTPVRKVEDEKDKAKTLIAHFFKFAPEFDVSEKVVVKGPQFLEAYVKVFSQKFKELMGKELGFELKEPKKEKTESSEDKKEESQSSEEKKE